MIKAVFFDAGETLVHRNPSLVNVVKRLLEKGGHKVDPGALALAIGSSAMEMKAITEEGVMPDSVKWDHYMRAVFRRLKILDENAFEKIKSALREGTSFRAYAEVGGVLRRLRSKKIILGVISNASRSLEKILERAGLKGAFDHVLVSEIEGVEKPHKRIFDRALKRTGVKKDEFMFIGDNYIADVEGARKAGVKAVWLSRRTVNAQFSFAHAADDRVKRVKNLMEFIQYMEKEKML
jgi:putative hydrolase of the HAD superfamily